MKLTYYKSYIWFWLGSSISYFGTYITTLALQVLIVINLQGSTVDVGLINSSRWLPYVLLGLIAGVIIDRVSRRSILIWTDFGRGFLLITICYLAVFETLNISFLMFIMVLFGAMSLFNDVASQSIVPQLVPKSMLMPAYARLEQSAAVAETSGPAVAGFLISSITAPFALLTNAVSYLFSGWAMTSIRHQPLQGNQPDKHLGKHLGKQIKEGLHWVYKHQYLKILAINTHAWFLFHSMLGAILVTFALTVLGFNASTFGLAMTSAGIGAVLGTTLSTRVSKRWGIGRILAFTKLLYAPAVIFMILAPATEHGDLLLQTFLLISAGQFLYGFTMGVEGPLEMAYRQTITPVQLQGRMNATMRSINRSMIVVGAPLGGLIADIYGFLPALWLVLAGLAFVGIWLAFSPIRNAQIEETTT